MPITSQSSVALHPNPAARQTDIEDEAARLKLDSGSAAKQAAALFYDHDGPIAPLALPVGKLPESACPFGCGQGSLGPAPPRPTAGSG